MSRCFSSEISPPPLGLPGVGIDATEFENGRLQNRANELDGSHVSFGKQLFWGFFQDYFTTDTLNGYFNISLLISENKLGHHADIKDQATALAENVSKQPTANEAYERKKKRFSERLEFLFFMLSPLLIVIAASLGEGKKIKESRTELCPTNPLRKCFNYCLAQQKRVES